MLFTKHDTCNNAEQNFNSDNLPRKTKQEVTNCYKLNALFNNFNKLVKSKINIYLTYPKSTYHMS